MTAITETTIETRARIQSWTVLRVFIGLVILTAALLKTHMLATSPSLGNGLLHSRGFNIFVAQFEICFGIWLLVGLMPKLTYLMSLGCFATFAGVSFYKAFVLQETSCGCWGTIQVSPYLTMAFDLVVIGLLIVFRPKGIVFHWKAFLDEMPELKRFRRVGIVVAVWMLLAIPMTLAMMSLKFTVLLDDSRNFVDVETITLEPSRWLGKKFPLIDYLELDDGVCLEKLQSGSWSVLFYHNDCQKCLQELESISENESLFIRNNKLLIIQVPGKEVNQKHIEFSQNH